MLTQAHSRIDYRVVSIAYLTFVALGLPGGLLGVAWPSIRDTFAVSDAALGILVIPTTAGYLSASLLSGRIVSRLGIGPALLIASLLSAAGLAGYGVAPGWWFMIVIGLVLGVGQGIIDAGINLHFASNFTPRLMNWLHASFGLGAALGPLLMTALFSMGQSWRVAYFIMAVIQVVLAVVFTVTLHRWRVKIGETQSAANIHAPSIVQSLRRPAVLLSIALFFVFTGVEATAGNWSFTLFTESRSIDIITAGQWVSFYWWSFTLGRLVFGFIANRIAIIPAIRVCFLLVLGGSALISLNLSDWLSFIGLALMGFALAPIFPLLTTNTPERLGSDHATNAIGFQVGAAGLGIASLPALAGFLAANIGIESIGPFLVVASLIALVLFLITNR